MEEKKINLADPQNPENKKLGNLSKIALFLTILLIFLFGGFSYLVAISAQDESNTLIEEIKSIPIFKNISHLTISNDIDLRGEKEDRINFLLLGIGGEGHDGANLTDTLMIISFQPSTLKTALISIPRDLYVNIPNYGQRKINNAHALGEMEEEGKGVDLLKQVILENFNIPIHYVLRADFDGFVTLIDEVGGLNVFVDNSFTDYSYPTNDYKIQTVSFKKGWQIMDGDTALKYVRSRHGTSGEASDFARNKRQQKIIQALKEKLISFNTLKNPKNISKIISTVEDHSYTDMEIWEMARVYKIAKDVNPENFINLVLDSSSGGYLYDSKTSDGQAVLLPVDGNFTKISLAINNIFQEKTTNLALPPCQIEIQNGTSKTGLAYDTSLILENLGFEIAKLGNANTSDYSNSIIYDLSQGKRQAELDTLKKKLGVESTNIMPVWLKSNADFVLILGADSIDKILAQNNGTINP